MSESVTPSGDVSPIHSERAAVPLITICACEEERLTTNTDCAHAAAATKSASPVPASAAMTVFISSSLRSLLRGRSEEHTSELQSLTNLVCRLLLEKTKTSASFFRFRK